VNSLRPHAQFELGLVVVCAGGMMDGYAFTAHDQVFATGQTGNVVRLALAASQLDPYSFLRYFIPIVSFVAGIILSRLVSSRFFNGRESSVQSWVIDFEAVTFAVIGVFSDYIPDFMSDCVIACCAAMSFENFRELGQGSRYSSTYCTGNLRSFSEALYGGLFESEPNELRRAFHYLSLIGSFFAGVVICGYFVERIGGSAALLISITFLFARLFVDGWLSGGLPSE
jgi:uncharacterized membrane protein YoaK (UPF0700 family)